MTTQLSWEHVYSRSQNERKAWDISVSKRNSHAYINGLEIPVQAMDTTALEFGVSDRIYIGDAIFYARLASKWGVSWFNTTTIKLDKDGPNTKYQMWLLDLDYRKPLELGHRPYTYTASFHGQWTKSGDRLYGTDQISMGNRYTVRGFDGEYTLMGESGWYLRQELSTPVEDIAGDIYLGLDVGAVYGPSTDMLVGRTIAGATLGARGQFQSGIGYDVAIGTPIYKPQGYPMGKTQVDMLVYYKF